MGDTMGNRSIRLAAAASVATAGMFVAAVPASADTDVCAPREVGTVASGFGTLENLAFDGRGGLLISDGSLIGPGALRRIAPDGTSGAVAEVTGPGGIVVDGDSVYLATGNTTAAGVLDTPDGSIVRIDLATGEQDTVATGIVMPNGLGLLPDGSLLASRDIGEVGLTHIPADGGEPRVIRTDLGSVNGIAVDGDTVYTVTTFDLVNRLHILDANDLTGPVRSIDLPGLGPIQSPDDLTVGPDGALYIALNLAGAVLRLDPETGTSCRVVEGIPMMSSVAFGSGPGWDPDTLYTVGFDGTVHAAHRVHR